VNGLETLTSQFAFLGMAYASRDAQRWRELVDGRFLAHRHILARALARSLR
jgi:hypothetical protein